jgi:transcriptional regulator with XRE-family HTH domain
MILPKYKIIEDIRLRRDLTYENLAREIGITKATLFNILNGRTDPQSRNQYKIEKWLNSQFITPNITPETELISS